MLRICASLRRNNSHAFHKKIVRSHCDVTAIAYGLRKDYNRLPPTLTPS
jgi:hypothetical protein